jgi:FecR protein
MKNIKVWPHLIIGVALAAVIAGVGTALYFRHEQTVQAEALPNAVRIQRLDGEVALSNGIDSQGNDAANAKWVAASANEPFSTGDRIYTRDNAHCSLAFSGRNFARLDPNTSLDAVTLADGRTQLALRDGSALFDVGYLAPGEMFEVGTPYGAVDFNQPGLYNVGINNDRAIISAFSGLAQVVGLGGSGQISKGEMLTLLGQTAAEATLSRLDRRNAGYQVNDYYRYQYPNTYDGRYSNYDAYENDPFYYDPYRRNASYKYVTNAIPGINDLDYYGDWQNVSGYGNGWRPRVDAGWTPYQQGSWTNDYPYGPTWVSSEPWGYAPYHYGRWANVGNQWFWIPEAVNTTPRYSPALVAFVSLAQNQIGWVPLGPGDPYVARYYNENWQPQYLTRGDIVPANLVNFSVPGAVTVVPIDAFGRVIDPRSVRRIDMQTLASVRPTLDPLTLTPLRNAVLNSAWGRGKIDLPPGIAKKLYDTRVVVSAAPTAPPFRKDLAKALRVEPVPENVRDQKLKIKDERNGEAAQPTDAARQQQIAAPAADAARGNKDAGQQARGLDQQQRKDLPNQQKTQQQAQRKAAPQAQVARVGQPAKSGAVAVPKTQPAQPQSPRKAAAAQPLKQQPKPQSQGAKKQEGKPAPPPSEGGKGKGKHP